MDESQKSKEEDPDSPSLLRVTAWVQLNYCQSLLPLRKLDLQRVTPGVKPVRGYLQQPWWSQDLSDEIVSVPKQWQQSFG